MRVDLAIIGAGPAGISAAASATSHGVRTMLFDRRAQVGGQYYARRLGVDWLDGLPGSAAAGLRNELLDVRMESEVWGAFPKRTLAFCTADGAESGMIEANSIIVATGASERPQPFPVWELPGVVSAGGVQLLLNESAVIPAGIVVVAGTGPFLLAVASQLATAGANLGGLVEARSHRELARLAPTVLGEPALWKDTLSMLRPIRKLDRRFGVTIRTAMPGQIVLSTGERIPCDTLCVGHGFTPRIELLAQLGCSLSEDGVTVTSDLETSQSGVFAAGETTGIGGARLAHAEGRLAGLVIADRLRPGAVTRRELEQAHRARNGLRRFAQRLFGVYQPLDPLALATPETTICRCEDVSLGEILATQTEPTVNGRRALKAVLRCGMGACQGLMCHGPVRAASGNPVENGWSQPAARPPVGSVAVSTVARLKSLS